MDKALGWFSGKKTYLVAVGTIAYLLIGYYTGQLPAIDWKTITEMAAIIFLRQGITKAGPPA